MKKYRLCIEQLEKNHETTIFVKNITPEEVLEVMLSHQTKDLPTQPKPEKKVVKAKRKKPLHTKKCPECNRGFKGDVGLGIHRQKVHGIAGKFTQKGKEIAKKEMEEVEVWQPYTGKRERIEVPVTS